MAAACALGLAAVAFGEAPPPPRRAVLVSFDGAGGREYERMKSAGAFGPDGFLAAEGRGLSAERLVVVTPSLTAVSHASISSGAPPARTGIVSNWMQDGLTPFGSRRSGFAMEPAVETLWEAAARQGKRVASVVWPGLPLATPRTSVPVGVRWDDPLTRSVIWSGPSAESPLVDALVALPLGIRSFSPPKSFTLAQRRTADGLRRADASAERPFVFVVVDSTDDGRRSYDEVVALGADGGVAARARAGDWFSLPERAAEGDGRRNVLQGRWGKVLALAPDLSAVTVYLGPLCRTYAVPEDFQRTLEETAGFWPGPPDVTLVQGALFDTKTFLEQAARFSRFFTRLFETARARGDWDLLFAYQPILDEVAHHLLLVDSRQAGYTPARAAAAAAALRASWRSADEAAAAYLSFGSEGDVLFVSDHGLRPVHRAVRVSDLLRRAGFLKADVAGGAPRVAPDSPADVVSSGGTAYVYLNRRSARPAGVLSDADADALLSRIEAFARGVVDEAGAPVFSTVVRTPEASALGLDHPNAGELILIAAPGTTLRWGLSPSPTAELFGTPENLGQHGYEHDPELDGVFFHVGEGIARERVPSVLAIDVAARVSARLGIAPPRGPAPAP